MAEKEGDPFAVASAVPLGVEPNENEGVELEVVVVAEEDWIDGVDPNEKDGADEDVV